MLRSSVSGLVSNDIRSSVLYNEYDFGLVSDDVRSNVV